MRHLLSQIFQQHINSATKINSHLADVTMLGLKQSIDYYHLFDAAPSKQAAKHAAKNLQLSPKEE